MIGLTNAFVPERGLGLSANIGKGTTWFNSNVVIFSSETNVALTANSTNYIFLNVASNNLQVNTTGYIANSIPLATVVTTLTGVASLIDTRPDFSALPGSSSSFNYSDDETLSGTGTSFTLLHTPNPSACLELFRNGNLLQQGVSYTLSGNAITLFITKTLGVILVAYYRY